MKILEFIFLAYTIEELTIAVLLFYFMLILAENCLRCFLVRKILPVSFVHL